MRVLSSSAIILLIFSVTESFGQENVNHLVSYQGRLTTSSGDPVPDATYSITFSIYDDLSVGVLLWTETHPSVATENGEFSVYIGGISPLPVDSLTRGDAHDPTPLYLEVQVGGDPPISPRTRLGGALYAAVSQRLEGDVSTKYGVLALTDPVNGDTTIASSAQTGSSVWRDLANNKQVTIRGTGIDIGHIGSWASDGAGAPEMSSMQGDGVELKSDADGPRLVVTSSTPPHEVRVQNAELVFKGLTDSSSFGLGKAEMTDAQGNKLVASPAGVSAYDGSAPGYIGSWSASRSFHCDPSTGDSAVFDLGGSGKAGLYSAGSFFEADHSSFESCKDDGVQTSCIRWSGAVPILAIDRSTSSSESRVDISPSTTNFVYFDGMSTDTVLSFGSDPTVGGWWRVKSRDPGTTWAEWSAPRSVIWNESTGDSLRLSPTHAGLFSATHTAEVTPSSMELTGPDDDCALRLTKDSISMTCDNGVDSGGIDAFLTDFTPVLKLTGTGGYAVILRSISPVLSVREHGSDPATTPSLTYSYDPLGRLINTIRAADGQDGDSIATSASGMQIFDGDLTLTHNPDGIEFYDGSSGLQTLVATAGGDIVAAGSITAASFDGNGSALNSLSASNLSSGIVAPAVGGTGLNTSVTSTGSMLYTSATGTWSTLPPGELGDVLTIGPSGAPNWSEPGISDARLKKNVSTIDGALDRILSLRGVTFEWKKDDSTDIHLPAGKQIGMIAQEVEQVVPELVRGSGDDYRAVDYGKLTAVLIEAVKELKAENNELREKVESLERITGALAGNGQ
ncbi:MAG: tail fiber domain-containing protein [Candidatus Zixiibacteriota bacterium]|nr:MAG: tail fiber domain-containing protein [candidate division Zixibacteria bacterium]